MGDTTKRIDATGLVQATTVPATFGSTSGMGNQSRGDGGTSPDDSGHGPTRGGVDRKGELSLNANESNAEGININSGKASTARLKSRKKPVKTPVRAVTPIRPIVPRRP